MTLEEGDTAPFLFFPVLVLFPRKFPSAPPPSSSAHLRLYSIESKPMHSSTAQGKASYLTMVFAAAPVPPLLKCVQCSVFSVHAFFSFFSSLFSLGLCGVVRVRPFPRPHPAPLLALFVLLSCAHPSPGRDPLDHRTAAWSGRSGRDRVQGPAARRACLRQGQFALSAAQFDWVCSRAQVRISPARCMATMCAETPHLDGGGRP